MDITTIGGSIASLKAAAEIAKTLVGIRDHTEIQSKVIQLQSAILSAQSDAMNTQTECLAARQRVKDLEGELDKMRAWEATKARYELVELPQNVYVYSLKAGQSTEPEHHICAHCYENQRKSILQSRGSSHGIETLHCPACGNQLRTGIFRAPPPPRVVRSAYLERR